MAIIPVARLLILNQKVNIYDHVQILSLPQDVKSKTLSSPKLVRFYMFRGQLIRTELRT